MGLRTGRPVARIELSAEVAGIVEGCRQRRNTAQALALRARIVLGCASGLSNKAVAARERGHRAKGRQVAPELCRARPSTGCSTSRGRGVPRKIDDAKVESIIVQTLESQPAGATH